MLTCYVRLQASRAKRDLKDIRNFTSDEVFEGISKQAQEDPAPGKTELLMIIPRIIEVRDVGNQMIVSVLYDVMMRENEDTLSKQVRELWHLAKSRTNPKPFGYWRAFRRWNLRQNSFSGREMPIIRPFR